MEEYITWIDVETTGIDAYNGDVLLEVACLITDRDLNIVDETGYQSTIYYSPETVERIKDKTVPFVLDMHNKTGLWEKLPTGKHLDIVEKELLAYIKQWVPESRATRLGGNSITLDRNFINVFLPAVGNHLHYRSIDVSSVAGLAQYWGGKKMQHHKKGLHSAFADITESIEELRYLRENAFKI